MLKFVFHKIWLLSLCFPGVNQDQAKHKLPSSVKEELYLKDQKGDIRRPNILLFNCNYGSGHKMATQGIRDSLQDCYIHEVDIYDQPLSPLDPLRKIFPQWSNEALYNNAAKHEHNQVLNLAGKIGPKVIFLQKARATELLKEFIAKDDPDLIISCVPLVNSMLLEAAEELNIPLLVVTTDIDISYFCYGFDERDATTPNQCKITVPFARANWDPLFIENIPKQVKSSLIYGFGYPTRRAFSETYDEHTLNKLRNEYKIQPDERVILVMMGGNTAHAALNYANLLLSLNNEEIEGITGSKSSKNRIRLLCLCGDTTQKPGLTLMEELNRLNTSKDKNNHRVTIHACSGTSRIAELVSLPELSTVISKPGGSTVNEMIKKRVPMIYHISKVPLDWEEGNMRFGVNRNLGKPFQPDGKDKRQAARELQALLSNTFSLSEEIQDGKISVPEAEFDFMSSLREVIKEMLQAKSKTKKGS